MHQEEEKRAGSLPEQTAQRIIAYIRAQKLQPGDRLPSEIALMRQLGVGRNTLREALNAIRLYGDAIAPALLALVAE